MGLHDAVAVLNQDRMDSFDNFRTHVFKGGTDCWIEQTDFGRHQIDQITHGRPEEIYRHQRVANTIVTAPFTLGFKVSVSRRKFMTVRWVVIPMPRSSNPHFLDIFTLA